MTKQTSNAMKGINQQQQDGLKRLLMFMSLPFFTENYDFLGFPESPSVELQQLAFDFTIAYFQLGGHIKTEQNSNVKPDYRQPIEYSHIPKHDLMAGVTSSKLYQEKISLLYENLMVLLANTDLDSNILNWMKRSKKLQSRDFRLRVQSWNNLLRIWLVLQLHNDPSLEAETTDWVSIVSKWLPSFKNQQTNVLPMSEITCSNLRRILIEEEKKAVDFDIKLQRFIDSAKSPIESLIFYQGYVGGAGIRTEAYYRHSFRIFRRICNLLTDQEVVILETWAKNENFQNLQPYLGCNDILLP